MVVALTTTSSQDAEGGEERREAVRQRARTDALLPGRAGDRAGGGRKPDERRVPDLDLAAQPVDDDAGERRDRDRQSEVAVAARSGSPATRMSSGTATIPPPTPKKAEKTPAASPMATRRTGVSYEHGQSGRRRRILVALGESSPSGPPRARPAADRHRDLTSSSIRALPVAEVRRLLGRARERRAHACLDGLRHPRCYVARRGRRSTASPSAVIADGPSCAARSEPAATTSASSSSRRLRARRDRPGGGGFYRVVDTGIVCVRAPCFSYRATQVNGSTRTTISSVDLAASARSAEIARAASGAEDEDGLYARGRFARPTAGVVFRRSALPQSAAASRLRTSQASRTSSSVVRKFPIASRRTYRRRASCARGTPRRSR